MKNGVVEQPTERKKFKVGKSISNSHHEGRNPLFADLPNEWLEFGHPDNIVVGDDFNFDKQIKLNTWAGYSDNIKHNIYPTFKSYVCTVREVTLELLKGHYSYRLKYGKKKSTFAKDFTIINQSLNYAISHKMLEINSNSSITLHYNAATFNAD